MASAALRLHSGRKSAPQIQASHRVAAHLAEIARSGLSLLAVLDRPNTELFEELAVPLFDSLFNFAQWLTHNREEAEDLVQETYAKALKGFSSFQPGTNFRAWIFRILRNTFLTSRTGLQVKMTVALESEEEEAAATVAVTHETPESILLQQVSENEVQAALERLSLQHREIILLCDVEDMRYEDIAQTLDIPIGTVMSRVARARKALRVQLTQSGTSRPAKSGEGRSC